MSGLVILTEEEKREMLMDARNPLRRAAFAAARQLSHGGTLDDYIDFLSENMGIVDAPAPRIWVTAPRRCRYGLTACRPSPIGWTAKNWGISFPQWWPIPTPRPNLCQTSINCK